MKRFSILAVCLFALLAFSTAAFAQDPQTPQGKRAGRHQGKLRQMDVNHDGQITRDEWKGKRKKFKRLDINHDGVITKEELKARHRQAQPSRPVPSN